MPMHALKRVRSAFQLHRRSHEDNDDELTPLGADSIPALPRLPKDVPSQKVRGGSGSSCSRALLVNSIPSPTDFSDIEFSMPQWNRSPTTSTASRAPSKEPPSRSEYPERSRQDSKLTGTPSSRASSRNSSSAGPTQTNHQHLPNSPSLVRDEPPKADQWINEKTVLPDTVKPASASPSKFGVRSRSTPSVPTLGLFPATYTGCPPVQPQAPPPVPPKPLSSDSSDASTSFGARILPPPPPRRAAPPLPSKSVSPRQLKPAGPPQRLCECCKNAETANRQGSGLSSQMDVLSNESLKDLMEQMQVLCHRLRAELDERKKLGADGL